MASLITYGSAPPHHPQQAKLGQEITGQYMPRTFLYVNNRFWLGKLQFFIGETDGPGRLYANVDVHVIKPVFVDLVQRGALSKSIYPMKRRVAQRGSYEEVQGAGIEIWGGSTGGTSGTISRCLVVFDPLTKHDGIVIEVSESPGRVGSSGQIMPEKGAPRERLYIVLERALMRQRASEALAHIAAWEAEGMPSVDHLQAFLEGKAHGVRIVEGPYPMSQASDWLALRLQKFMPSAAADVANHEAL